MSKMRLHDLVDPLDWYERRIIEFIRLYVKVNKGIDLTPMDPNVERDFISEEEYGELNKFVNDKLFNIEYSQGLTPYQILHKKLSKSFGKDLSEEEMTKIMGRQWSYKLC